MLIEIKDECLSDPHSKLNIPVSVSGVEANALVDTGSALSQVSDHLIKRLNVKLERSDHCDRLAVNGLNRKVWELVRYSGGSRGGQFGVTSPQTSVALP